jgi:predicted O-linked N-acetylglucosamine transferase (SPINDLY family)
MNKILFGQAKDYLDQSNYEKAIALLENCIEQNPEGLNYYWYLGLAYLLQGENDQAQEIWMSCLLENPSSDNNIEQLIKILKTNIRYHLNKKEPDFEIASTIISVLSEIDENFDNSNLFTEIYKNIEFLKKEALGFALSRKFPEARDLYEKILLLYPNDDEVLYQLGMVYFELKDYEQSQAKVIAALDQNPEPGIYYDGLGLILEKTQQFDKSIKAYLLAIEKNKKNTESYIKLANLLKELALLSEAKTIYQQAMDNDIEHFAIYMNYANLLMADKQYEEAVDLYKKAIILKNDYASIYYNLALALEKLGRQTESLLYNGKNAYHEGRIIQAFEYFELYRSSDQADLDFYNELIAYYQSQRMQEALIPIAQEGIKKYPESIRQRFYLIQAYQGLHRPEDSLKVANEAIAFFENEKEKSFIFEVYKQGILPVVYNTELEIELIRKEYLKNLQVLIERPQIEDEDQKKFVMFILRSRNNYYCHFHNKNDLEIQIEYATFVRNAMENFYPDWMKPLLLSDLSNSDKIRIGYVCHRSNGLGQLFLDWIKYRNQQQFETYFYDIGSNINAETESFRLYSDYYYHIPGNIEKVAQTVLDDNLHILVFLDVGIEPDMYCLSSLRLAPIQCNTWGHPITSGSSQIDYFLGSDAMEPANAQEHYSETLIRLPNLGITIPAPELPTKLKTRSEFDLSEEDIIYISCQMTAKYLPQHDYLFCEIAKQVPNAKILFSEAYESPEMNQKFKARLQGQFEAYQLDFETHCIFTPRVSKSDYLNILCLADVFLDTIGWSGGLTSLDAIACTLPIVTLPGEFMRGRQSFGMLKIIGVTETIAKNEQDYIDIAVKLGLEPQWRKQIKENLKVNYSKLFDDLSCVKALESFYTKVIQEIQDQ